MATTETDLLEGLWSGVIDSISQDSPQNRAFLTLTKPLGLLKSEGGSNLLVAAPNGFAKDVLESRLKGVLNDALSEKLGERIKNKSNKNIGRLDLSVFSDFVEIFLVDILHLFHQRLKELLFNLPQIS